MLESIPLILLIGTILGFLAGLGTGGGSLLILWLTFVLDVDPVTARSINLLFFIPSAVISCFIRLRKGSLKFRPILPGILSGCIAALLFSFLSTALDVALLKKLFGVLLIFAGLGQLFRKQKKPSSR